MTFHNIFSNKPSASSPQYQKIIIDIHEKNSLVPAELSHLSIPFEFQHLEVGDYFINNTLIERKTIQDLKSSIISKRIFEQIKNLKQHPSPLLLLEGAQESLTNNTILHENAIRGFLLSLVKEKIHYILTQNEKDTALYLSILARTKKPSQISLRPSRLPGTKAEQAQFILEGFPGIGPAKAKFLLSRFHSLKNIFNAEDKELQEVLGKKAKDFISILQSKFLDNSYQSK